MIENVGKSIARDIKLEFTPPLQVSPGNIDRIEDNTLLKNGIKSLVPGYKIPIPFDFLTHYFRAKLPKEYTVKVTYLGDSSPLPMKLEYPLDLNHFNYIHFGAEVGLSEIDQTLERLVQQFSHYSSSADTMNVQLNHIANAINRGLIIKNRLSVNLNGPDIAVVLKEFVYLWMIDYGKKQEKWNRPFIFGLTAKAALMSEELLKSAIAFDSSVWAERIKQVIDNLSKLASIGLVLDAPDGTFSTLPVSIAGGISKKDFDDLGDSIIEDSKKVIELLEAEDASLSNGNAPIGHAHPVETVSDITTP